MIRLLLLILLLGFIFTVYWYYDRIMGVGNSEPKITTPPPETMKRETVATKRDSRHSDGGLGSGRSDRSGGLDRMDRVDRSDRVDRVDRSDRLDSKKKESGLSFIDPETDDITNKTNVSIVTNNTDISNNTEVSDMTNVSDMTLGDTLVDSNGDCDGDGDDVSDLGDLGERL